MRSVRLLKSFLSGLLLIAAAAHAEEKAGTNSVPPPIPYLSPAGEAKTFFMPPGYHMELVVSEPVIKEPVVAVFDGNGRMFVAEMRSYMQNIDGTNEHAATSRVSMHWSSKGNGVYDRHSVFIDHLVLPRMILPLENGLLVNETDSDDLWLYRDTHGTGVADKKELFYDGGTRGGNLEHQQSGLIWDRDNWLYQTVNSYRLRLVNGKVIKEATPANGGQWGLSQDDYGKLWFVNAAGELGPVNFQEPIIYGEFSAQGQPSADFMAVWPLVGLADVQGGLHRVRPKDQTLNHLTACCGPDIFRGDRLPSDLQGNLFFGEPVGRLVRRATIQVDQGVTKLTNPYVKSEFLRSTDPNFRPINMVTAPDGTLYIVDMYRGIIQEGEWVREGSYLRPMIEKYQFQDNFGRGRIWRLTHDGFHLGPTPHMLDETSAQLVPYLAHPNGWWRDTAQKLLVLRNDKSVVPALNKMANENQNPLARIDALWTLEGLGAASPALVKEKLADKDFHVRVAAIRVSESLYKKGDKSLVPDVKALAYDPNPNVVIQVMMTAHLLNWPGAVQLIEKATNSDPAEGVKEFGSELLRPPASHEGFTKAQEKLFDQGAVIYKELCFACHGSDGKGAPLQGAPAGVTIAPPLSRAKMATGFCDGIINVVLKGLKGPVNGKNYGALMVPMESNKDRWVAAVASYVRHSFGNKASFVEPSDVERVRAASKNRSEPWTLDELQAALPQPLTDEIDWKVSASNQSSKARLAIDGDIKTRYDTGVSQAPGMWFEVELPKESTISGLELDAADSARDYPRGYTVTLSDDGKTWGKPVATGEGKEAATEIFFPPAKSKYIRITQTKSAPGLYWSIHELTVFKPGKPVPGNAAAMKKPAVSQYE